MMMDSELYFDPVNAVFTLIMNRSKDELKKPVVGHFKMHRIVFSEVLEAGEQKAICYATLKGSILLAKIGNNKPFTFFVSPANPYFVHREVHLDETIGQS